MNTTEATLLKLAHDCPLNDNFFRVVDLLKSSGQRIDFSKPVALTKRPGVISDKKKPDSLPLRNALFEEALEAGNFVSQFFRAERIAQLKAADPLFFDPEKGVSLTVLLDRIISSENDMGFPKYGNHGSVQGDAWLKAVFENFPVLVEDVDYSRVLARQTMALNCPEAFLALLKGCPSLTTAVDDKGRFWLVQKNHTHPAWVFNALQDAGVDMFRPEGKSGAPLWRSLVPVQSKLSIPEEGTLRKAVEQWIRQERKNASPDRRAFIEEYLIESGLRFMSSSPVEEERMMPVSKMSVHLHSLPAAWVNHMPTGSDLPASLKLLFRKVKGYDTKKRSDVLVPEGARWAEMLAGDPAWSKALSPFNSLCVKIFLVLHGKDDLLKHPPTKEQIDLVQSPGLHGFFQKVKKETGLSADSVLVELKNLWLDHTLPAPSSVAPGRPRF